MLFDYLLPDIGSIYPLLDHHGLTRHEIHLRCMKALKGKLLHQLETAQMDNARLDIIFCLGCCVNIKLLLLLEQPRHLDHYANGHS